MAYPLKKVLANNTHKWLIALRIVLIIILLWWMFVIFNFSAQNGTQSTQASDQVVEVFGDVIAKVTGNDHIKIKLTVTYRSQFEYGIRKLAHMFIYFILAITAMLLLFTFDRIPMLVRMLLSVFGCFHQSFSYGRGPSFRDVLIDTFGASMGIIVALILFCIIYTIYHSYQAYKIKKYNASIREV
ncbi:VanZ family protein [uncultured Sharpea sp.]|uniref:VanZ family protein n=1 Tax=uncultured Sharpea sp. TaxID=1112738 RepID=UPI0025860BAB|nr:VanZ family protein [uncultured Sharpea sp.]